MSVSVLGSLNLDHVWAVPVLPGPGMTVIAETVTHFAGGKGLNQAIAAVRMGSVTRMIGAVGNDAAGRMLIDTLAEAGAQTDGVLVRDGEETGRAYIALSSSGENQIVVTPGANRTLTVKDAAAAARPEDRVFLAQLEIPVEVIAAFFQSGPAQAGRKILNAAPALTEGARLFPLADMLIFNQSEFAAYLQLEAEPQTLDDLLVARRILTKPNQAAVVTLGSRGAAAIWADRTLFVPAFAFEPVDTTGAGDCFCGVVAAAVAQGIGPETAMLLANAAAGLSTQTLGAANAMPARDQVEALIAQARPATAQA
jgi:ribokinase